MEDEDTKPLIHPTSSSRVGDPTNHTQALSLFLKSEKFAKESQNYTAENNHVMKDEFITNDLSDIISKGMYSKHYPVLHGKLDIKADVDFPGAIDNNGLSHYAVEQNDPEMTSAGSKRKRKNSNPMNYFDHHLKLEPQSDEVYSDVDDEFLEEQEESNEKESTDADEPMDGNFDLSNQDMDRADDDTDKLTRGEPPYKCDKCSESFPDYRELSKHTRTHTEQQLYICSICDENFFLSENLEIHMKSHMEGVDNPQYKCCTCNRSFSDPDSLSEHLEDHTKNLSWLGKSSTPSGQIYSAATSSTQSAGALKDSKVKLGKNLKESFFEENMMNFKQRYPCKFCDSTFVSPSSLKTHVRTHTGEKPFQCSICQMTFSLSNNLLTHMRKHTGERPYKCSLCGRGFSKSSDVTRHMKIHTGEKPFTCSVCHKAFSDITKLKMHMRIHIRNLKNQPYQCDICSRRFCEKSTLNIHVVKFHKIELSDYNSNIQPTMAELRRSEEKALTFIHENTNVKDHLRLHLEKMKKDNVGDATPTEDDRSPNEEDVSDVKDLKQEAIRDDSVSHVTEPSHSLPRASSMSNDEFEEQKPSLTDIKQEINTQIKDLNTTLPQTSNMKFLTINKEGKYELIDPNSLVLIPSSAGGLLVKDTGVASSSNSRGGSRRRTEKEYKCTECDKEFRSASALNIHVRSHTGERPFECSMCDWTFSILGNLKAHMKTHSGEKPYRCEVCDKAFTKKCDVKRHFITHTGERNHVCLVCGKTFSQKCVLSTHMLLHSGEKPYKCDECEKAFSQRVQLLSHVKIHKGERPYKCPVCEKVFREKVSLETHQRIHTGEMPFQCTTCGKLFRDKSYLRKHVRRYHE